MSKRGGFEIAVWCNVTHLSAGNFRRQTCHNIQLIARSAQAVYDRVIVVLYTYFKHFPLGTLDTMKHRGFGLNITVFWLISRVLVSR
jgi:hypothetical protein